MIDTPPARPRLLIVSFSPIAADARVLKQVSEFAPRYEVITCGYGEAPPGVARHIRIPDSERINDLDGRLITLHWYSRAYWRLSAVRWTRKALAGLVVDVAIANDVEAVPVALQVRPRFGVHADLHEYSPRLHEEIPAWLRRIKPYYDWLCRRYVARASSWSTVSAGLAREYAREFGFTPVIVTNAAPYADLTPQAVASPIRLVHSGACLRNRNLMALVDGVGAAAGVATLDLYLTPNDPGLLDELKERAATTPGVEVRDPVPYQDLIRTLNAYDAGVHLLPPVNFNNEWALPNKIFDYVQARLGVIVGPSAEMAQVVSDHGIGVVTENFSADALRKVVADLDSDIVTHWKHDSDAAAWALSSETQVAVWAQCIDRLMNQSSTR